MSDASMLPEAVQWHEGMLLTPQHFQQAALRQDMLLHYHLSAAIPYGWGVRRLKIDPAALVSGEFVITDLEAVMPDGLSIVHPLEGQDLRLDLSDHQEAVRQHPQLVHIVVPVQRSSAPAKGELARFASVEGLPVADLNTGEGQVSIPRLRPRPRLMLGDDIPRAYVSMPVARVMVREESLTLDEFVPPLLMVSADTDLAAWCKSLARRVREKATYLVERVRAPTAATADNMIAETRHIVAALMADLPAFEALLNSGVSHPFPLYVTLCSMLGKLSVLSPELMPPALPAYDHADLGQTFGKALEFALRMVDNVHETCMAVPFRMHEGSFSLPLRESWVRKRLIIGIRRRAGATDADAVSWVEDAIIGAASRVQSIGERRIRGAVREVIERDEDLGVAASRGQTLLAVTFDADFIVPGEPLVVINRSDLRGLNAPAEVVLFVPTSAESMSSNGASGGRESRSDESVGAQGRRSDRTQRPETSVRGG